MNIIQFLIKIIINIFICIFVLNISCNDRTVVRYRIQDNGNRNGNTIVLDKTDNNSDDNRIENPGTGKQNVEIRK